MSGIISAGAVYADEFRLAYSDENLVSYWLDIDYKESVDGGWDVWVKQNSVFHYDTIYDAPEQMHFQIVGTNGGVTDTATISIRDEIEVRFNPAPELPTEEPKITPEIQAGIDEKIAEREQLYEDAVTCKAYGTEGNSMFQSYLKENISKIREQFTSLPVNTQEANLIKAHEACRVFFEVAVHISDDSAMLNKFKAQQQAELQEAERLADLETTTDYTDPITQEDIDETIETAEETLIKYPGFYKNPYGDCEPADSERCQNRGGPTEGAECGLIPSETGYPTQVCPQKAYNDSLSNAVSEKENYDIIQQLVCDKYLGQYEHQKEIPHWLAHCEIE